MFKTVRSDSLRRFLHYTKTKVWCVSVRRKHVWTQARIVKSPFDDVVVPNVCINEYMWRNLDKWPKKTAIVCAVTNRSYTYEQLYKKTQAFGASLRQKLNIVDQDAVAIILPNIPEYPIAAFGTIAAGGIATPFHPDFTAYELQRQLTSSEAKAIVTVPEKVQVIREALVLCKRDLPIICVDMNQAAPEGTMSFKEAIEDCHVDLDILKQVKICPEDISFLPYSSGTTGQPKGVQLTHRNIIANCEQQNTECRLHSHTTEQYQDSIMAMIPFFHSYGLTLVMIHKLSVGVRVVAVPKFEPERFLNVLMDYKISLLPMVPPIVKFLASYPQATSKHLENVNLIMSGGAPLPVADIHGILEKAKSDVHFNQSYGLTETSPLATTIPKGFKDYTSVGLPLPNIELIVVDEQFNNLGPNEAGELLIRGPNVMKGYKNNPDAKNEIFVEGGWLRTGDLATVSETGVVNICDRLKELIKVKGHQVAPAELESVIRDHPAVADTAVVGIPDPTKGEVPKAFVVLKEGVKADEKDIMNFVAERLIAYKRLKSVTFVDTIPKTTSGKILRRLFKD